MPTRFYVFERWPQTRYDTDFVDAEPSNTGEPARCPKCGRPIGMLPWLPPFRAELRIYGQTFGDVAYGPAGNILVSARFAETYQLERLVGLVGFEAVEIVGVQRRGGSGADQPTPRYVHAAITAGGAVIDEARSRLRRSGPVTCDVCRSDGLDTVTGFLLDKGTWTGEDVFYPRGLSGIAVASERFRDFIARHQFTNVNLIPTQEYVWPRSRASFLSGILRKLANTLRPLEQ